MTPLKDDGLRVVQADVRCSRVIHSPKSQTWKIETDTAQSCKAFLITIDLDRVRKFGQNPFSPKLPLLPFHGHKCGKKPIRLKLENGEADNFAMCFKLIKI